MQLYICFSLQKLTHHEYSSCCCIQFRRQAGKEAGGGYRRGLCSVLSPAKSLYFTPLLQANVLTNSVVASCATRELSISAIKEEEEESFLDDWPHKTEIILVQTLLCWLMLRIRIIQLLLLSKCMNTLPYEQQT